MQMAMSECLTYDSLADSKGQVCSHLTDFHLDELSHTTLP